MSVQDVRSPKMQFYSNDRAQDHDLGAYDQGKFADGHPRAIPRQIISRVFRNAAR